MITRKKTTRTRTRGKPASEPVTQPIRVLTTSTPERKMAAIENLSIALRECAKALTSVSTEVHIKDCTFSGMSPAITVEDLKP